MGAATETVLQFLFLVIAGRQLGPVEFGFYGYLLSLVTFAVTTAHYGLPVVAVRELAQRPSEESAILAATFRIRAGLSVVVFAGALIAAMVTPGSETHRAAIWLMFAYLLFLPFDLSLLFDARKLSRWDVPGKLAGRISSVGLLALLWYLKGSVTVADVALCSSVLMMVSAAVGWQVARRQHLPLHWLIRTKETKPLLIASAPILWSNVMTIAYTQSQTIVLKWLSTAAETGYYALASRLMMPVLVFRGVIYRVMLPLVSEVALDKQEFTARLERIFPVLALIFMPAVAIAIPLSEVIIVPLFGPDYQGAILPFQITISVLMLSGMGAMFGTSLLATGDARTPTVGLTIGCAISIGVAALTVPSFGATGAAWSAFLGELISVGYAIPKFFRYCHPRIAGRLTRIALVSISSTIVYYLLTRTLGIPGVVSLIGSLFALLLGLRLIGEISPSRLRAMFSLFRKSAPAPIETEQPVDL